MAGDEDDIGVSLGHASGDGADADFGDEFDVDAGAGVGVFEVVDQLGEVLDRIDVMVRRRRDEADAWGRVAHLSDPRIDFRARQFTAFTGFGTLGDFDLDFIGIDQVFTRDSESTRGHLFDGRAFAIAVRQWDKAFGVLSTFSGVRLPADAVHGDGEGFVGLLRD